jgi:uncharacterized protein (TIGR03067 family)
MFQVALYAAVLAGSIFGQDQLKGIPSNDRSVPPDEQKIIEQLQGKWGIAEALIVMKNVDHQGLCFEFSGTTCRAVESKKNPVAFTEFSIDTSKDPMWMDSPRQKGIIRLQGGTVTICLMPKKRPTSFSVPAGEEFEFFVLKRSEPQAEGRSKSDASPVRFSKSLEQIQGSWTYMGVSGGKTSPENLEGEKVITINGDILSWEEDKNDTRRKVQRKLEVNESSSPRSIDWLDTSELGLIDALDSKYRPQPVIDEKGDAAFYRVVGIFRIDGDTLTICVGVGGLRPGGFDRMEGKQLPMLFKRKTSP